MGRYTDTRALVQEHARQMLSAGTPPTLAAIRAAVEADSGVKASPNLVSQELQRFWALISVELSQRANRPGVPAEVLDAVEAGWHKALEAAEQRWAPQRQALAEQLSQAQAQAVSLTSDLALANQMAQRAEESLHELRRELSQVREVLQEESSARRAAQEEAQHARTAETLALERLRTSQTELNWARESHEKELATVNERLASLLQAHQALDQALGQMRSERDASRAALHVETARAAQAASATQKVSLQLEDARRRLRWREHKEGRRVSSRAARSARFQE